MKITVYRRSGTPFDVAVCVSRCARAEHDESLIFAKLERNLLAQWRRVNTYLDDRRPSLYGPIFESRDEIQ